MTQRPNYFGICSLCKEVNPWGSEVATWITQEGHRPGSTFLIPKEIRCGACDGTMPVEDWCAENGRAPIRLKTNTEQFQDIYSGLQRYELRRNDRDYQVGDQLILLEHNQYTGEYSDREIHCTVIHITYGGRLGLPKAYCVMGIFLHGTQL